MTDTRTRALHAAQLAADKKATDIVIFDLDGICTFTDAFVLCTAGAAMQVRAIADNIVEGMEKLGSRKPIVDGLEGLTWVVLDYGDFLVHVMSEDARAFYNLEGLWGDAPTIPFEDSAEPIVANARSK